ncbi:MAG: hypothetical protein KAV82_06250 [Phycisphaerae bacterium]|nr:hypothetical protein [Phycisphaerae bacterium]
MSLMIEEVADGRAHYLRLSAVNGSKRMPVGINPPGCDCAVASAQWLCYEQERIFEMLPEMLAAIHKRDQSARVIIESDADPALIHAYPYDQQLFVMPAPRSLSDVFRSSTQAARALQDVLDDTAEFAAEVFGVPYDVGYMDDDSWQDRDLLSKSQIEVFLQSPLGNQLATRIQLRPEYHGLVESDIVVINTAAGEKREMAEGCCRRLEQLLHRVQTPITNYRTILCCNPDDPQDPRRHKLLNSLRALCSRQ